MATRTTGDPATEEIASALLAVSRLMNQVKAHDALCRQAGVDFDRSGAALLFKLYAEGENLRITELAERLAVDGPAVTRKVQQLERDGLLQRSPDPDDARASRVSLSAMGRQGIEQLLMAREQWFGTLLEGWSDRDRREFRDCSGCSPPPSPPKGITTVTLEQETPTGGIEGGEGPAVPATDAVVPVPGTDGAAGSVSDPTDAEHAKAEHRRILVIVFALMLGMTLASLDQLIVATALPVIARDLHGLHDFSWVVTAYLLTLCISTPLWGKLGDLYGRKKLFQAAIVIFLVGSIFAGASMSIYELIACRAVQGVGAGGLMVGAQAIIGDVVSPRQRGRYMGYFGAVFAITSVAGPLLGGFFTQHLSWRWIFYINVPIGIVALFVIGAVLHIPRHRTEHAIDYVGTMFLGAATTALILLTTWGGSTYAWGSWQIISLAIGAGVLILFFCLVERRASEPVMPLLLFKNQVFSVATALGFIAGFIMFGAIYFIPFYLQEVHGASPTSSGLQLLPLVFGMLLTFIPSGRLVTRWGRYKIFPVIGTAILTVGLYLLSTMTPTTSLFISSVYMFIIGLGIGMIMQVLVVAAQNSVPYSYLGTATSTSTYFRTIGGGFGVALFGSIFYHRFFIELPKYVPPAALHSINWRQIVTTPVGLKELSAAVHAGYVQAVSNALNAAFFVGVPLSIGAFVLALFLKEVPFRDRAFIGSDNAKPADDAGGVVGSTTGAETAVPDR